jgi:hypothetical protein
MSGFDLKQVSRNDKGLIGAGIVVFIASFLPYWGWSGKGLGSYSTSAWTGYAVLGLLLLFIAAGLSAARVVGNANLPKLPLGPNLIVAGLSALGALLVILRGFTYPHASIAGASLGVKWGGYILMIAAIVQTVFAVMNFMASAEKLSWDATAMSKPTTAGGAPVPPAQASSPTDQPASSPTDQV